MERLPLRQDDGPRSVAARARELRGIFGSSDDSGDSGDSADDDENLSLSERLTEEENDMERLPVAKVHYGRWYSFTTAPLHHF